MKLMNLNGIKWNQSVAQILKQQLQQQKCKSYKYDLSTSAHLINSFIHYLMTT